jgi:hypothetical protein
MAAPLTPVPATQSTVVSLASDSVTARVGSFGFVAASNTSNPVMGTGYSLPPASIVTPAAGTNQFSLYTIARNTYNPIAPTAVTTFVGAQSTPVIVTTQKASVTVQVKNVTQYFQITPSNNTVYNASNSPSNLLVAGLNDIVSYTWQVAEDAEA